MKIRELLPNVKVHGRTVYDENREALFCNWSCSGFTVRLTGTYLKVRVMAFSDQLQGMPGMPQPPADWPCIGAVVDDELINRHECHSEDEWLTLWQSDTPATKDIRVIKLSENARGKLGIIEVETDGEFHKYESHKKTVEIIGDSITCGFGNEAENNGMIFRTSEENGWTSYAALGARELDYEFSMICESGISSARPEHPMFPMHAMEDIYAYTDELYDRKFGREPARWDFEKNHNDIVVINLGTNDSNPIRFYRDFNEIETMEKWFHARYKEFVKQVRNLNGPDTYIMCGLGSMDYYLYHHIKEVVNEIKQETGDENICCFEFIPINIMFEGYGAMGHPSAKTHARMGKELANYIRKFTGE